MKMKTARIHAFGDASVIRYDDVPRPRPGTGEVLVRVAATSFNPTEAALRAGLLQTFVPVDLPYTPGWDVAGTVAEIGPGAEGFTVGDRVVGRLEGAGAAAEYVRAPGAWLVPAPASVPLTHAAALPLAGLTAWQAVFEHGEVAAGQRVLINGAGGGVGGFVTQLAKHAGAEVTATASARSDRAVRRHGADHVIDYTAGPVATALDAPVDTLLNLVPLSSRDAIALGSVVRPGGRIVSTATPVEPPADTGCGRRTWSPATTWRSWRRSWSWSTRGRSHSTSAPHIRWPTSRTSTASVKPAVSAARSSSSPDS